MRLNNLAGLLRPKKASPSTLGESTEPKAGYNGKKALLLWLKSLDKLKLVTVSLLLFTAVSGTVAAMGVITLVRAHSAINAGISQAQAAIVGNKDAYIIEETTLAPTDNLAAAPSPPVQPVPMVGSAILTIHGKKDTQVAVYDGLTSDNLWRGVARVSESSEFGGAGNCVIFGHRDIVFRVLKDLKIGDKVTLSTCDMVYTYLVSSTEVCAPDSPEITQGYDTGHLSLLTCYPFVYSGPANERYLVVCELESSEAATLT
ncbi:MAG: class D sortase [Oscillospiraceae bacterium]